MAPSSGNSLDEFSFRTRQRHWDFLKNNPQHVMNAAIIGGGIVGAGILRELSLRGVSDVALFEKNDFASGTSGASSKLIHAGIRYLEQVWVHTKHLRLINAWRNFRFVIEASRERKILGSLAPPLIKPKPIFLVLSKSDPRSSLSVAMGVWLYYFIQLLQEQFFPAPVLLLTKKSIRSFSPELNAEKVKAIFSFWDSETDDARLVIENLQSANQLGGWALNYVELLEWERVGPKILITLQNQETGETLHCKTNILINASGAFVDEIIKREKGMTAAHSNLIDRVAGSHLDVYPALTEKSYCVSASDNRLVFVLRREEDALIYTRIGTTERPLAPQESSETPLPTQGELNYLESLAKEYFPKAVFNDQTIIRTDAGIRPLRAQIGDDAFHKSREHDIIEDRGVFHIVGVKLTDYRRVATELIGRLPFKCPKRRDTTQPLRSHNTTQRLYAEATIADVVAQTMALHWDDVVLRRRGLAPQLLLKKNAQELERQFDEMARVMNWNNDQTEREKKRAPTPGGNKA